MAQSSDAVETPTSETATYENEPETNKLETEVETDGLETETHTKEPETESETKTEANEFVSDSQTKSVATESEADSDIKREVKGPEDTTEAHTKTETSASENKDQPRPISADGNETSLNSSFNRDIENLIKDVQELHDLDEEVWSLRKYHYSPKGTTCRGAYNSERKMMRIKGAIEAPLDRVLSYILEPPFGYRKESQSSYRVIEKVGSGAVFVYKEKPEQTACCFRIAPRDGVYLAVLRVLTSETAIFAMKTVTHESYPPSEDGYRVSVPLIGFYVKQEGHLTAVEYYFAETDLGGKLGKAGPGKSIDDNVKHMIHLTQSVPKVKDGIPPYQQLL